MLIKKVDRDLARIVKKIGNSHFNPINAKDEMIKTFNDNNYNPKLKYLPQNKNIESIDKKLLALRTDNSVFGMLLKKKIIELHNIFLMIKNTGKEGFT